MSTPRMKTGIVCIALASFLAGCFAGADDCADGVDNDGDGLVDLEDPGCALNGDLEAPDPNFPQCSDNTDNDGDGLIDLDDPGCINPDDDDETDELVAACRNGIDDDSDGLIDFPNDPGCSISLEDSEDDNCPAGTDCPACSNEVDDDGDGDVDYPDDLGCNSAADNDEFNSDPTVCGGAVAVLPLPADNIALGTAIAGAANHLISQGCGGSGPETAYTFTVTTASAIELSTVFDETNVDTVLYMRGECRMPDTELGCNDDNGGETRAKLFLPRVEPGDYFIIVDAQPSASGEYKLQVTLFIPEGEACDPVMPDCAPGLDCRIAAGGVSETCEVPLTGPTCDDGGVIRQKVVPTIGDIVISEYMANPNLVSDAAGEWFELRVNTDVDIGGLQLGRAEPTGGPQGVLVTLDPTECFPVTTGSHILFARNGDVAMNGGLPAVDHIIGFDVVNSDDGLFIGMDDVILDTVTYSSTTVGTSSARDPANTTFCDSTTPYGLGDLGTPAAANQACP